MISDRLAIQLEQGSDALVLALHGELDVASAQLLADALGLAETTTAKHLVIDLRGLEFMDSSGLHVLLEANWHARENGHRLSLLKAPRSVHRVFELTQTSALFHFDGDPEDHSGGAGLDARSGDGEPRNAALPSNSDGFAAC